MRLEITDTKVPMYFDWYLTGPQGARYELYILKSYTKAQIEEAKAYLRRNYDVVKIYHVRVTESQLAQLKVKPILIEMIC